MFYCNQVSYLIRTVVQWSGISSSISVPLYRDIPQRGFQPDHLQYICFPLSLFFSTLHLALFTWHQMHVSYQKKTTPSIQCNNARIDSRRDTWFISSTYWAGLTIQQRTSIRGVVGRGWGPTLWGDWEFDLDIWPPIMQQVRGQLPK